MRLTKVQRYKGTKVSAVITAFSILIGGQTVLAEAGGSSLTPALFASASSTVIIDGNSYDQSVADALKAVNDLRANYNL